MSYNENFKECVYDAVMRDSLDGEFYIGTGNPDSEILIIGKECGFDPAKNSIQWRDEIVNNPIDWKKIYQKI